jgi:hypothetical protein
LNQALSKTIVWIVILVTPSALVGTHLPLLIRAAALAWLFVFSHIFWGF